VKYYWHYDGFVLEYAHVAPGCRQGIHCAMLIRSGAIAPCWHGQNYRCRPYKLKAPRFRGWLRWEAEEEGVASDARGGVTRKGRKLAGRMMPNGPLAARDRHPASSQLDHISGRTQKSTTAERACGFRAAGRESNSNSRSWSSRACMKRATVGLWPPTEAGVGV
jgi:hypothetical protein